MKRVYADKSLGISSDIKFKQPEGYSDCDVSDPTSVQRAGAMGSGTGAKADSEPTEMPPPDNSGGWDQNPQ
jgi:hypothetical protein